MKKLKDFTLNEIKAICENNNDCLKCTFNGKCPKNLIWDNLENHYFDEEFDEQEAIKKVLMKPKYRPFKDTNELIETLEELRYSGGCTRKWKEKWEMPLIWVKGTISGHNSLITSFNKNTIFIDNKVIDMDELFDYYTFLDGTPCGVKEK